MPIEGISLRGMGDESKDLERAILPKLHADEAGHLRAELDELRSLVTRGDPVNVTGGPVMVWWASVLIVANTLRLLEALHVLHVPFSLGLAEVTMGYCGNLALVLLRRKQRRVPTWRSRTLSAMWFAGGIGIFVFVGGCIMAGINDPRTNIAFIALSYSLIMMLTAVVAERRWMYIPGIAWAGVALAVFHFDGPVVRPVLFGAATLFFMLIPGLVLTLEERKMNR